MDRPPRQGEAEGGGLGRADEFEPGQTSATEKPGAMLERRDFGNASILDHTCATFARYCGIAESGARLRYGQHNDRHDFDDVGCSAVHRHSAHCGLQHQSCHKPRLACPCAVPCRDAGSDDIGHRHNCIALPLVWPTSNGFGYMSGGKSICCGTRSFLRQRSRERCVRREGFSRSRFRSCPPRAH